MLKKIYFSLFIALTTTQAHGMSTLENQLSHIKSEMLIIKRAWNIARIHIKLAQKTAPTLYQSIQPIVQRALESSAFITYLQSTVTTQFEAIANRNMSFNSVKTEFNFSTFFPKTTINSYGQNLFSAMARKQCYLLLGQKLAQKMQELKTEIQAAQQTPTSFPVFEYNKI